MIQAAKRRDETLRRQFIRTRALAFPGGHAQERTIGVRVVPEPVRPGARRTAGRRSCRSTSGATGSSRSDSRTRSDRMRTGLSRTGRRSSGSRARLRTSAVDRDLAAAWVRIARGRCSPSRWSSCASPSSTTTSRFARLIDARLHGERERVLPRVFARPLELRRGQSLSDRQLIDRLNDLGYAQRDEPDKPGEFAVGAASVAILPRARRAERPGRPRRRFRSRRRPRRAASKRPAPPPRPLGPGRAARARHRRRATGSCSTRRC